MKLRSLKRACLWALTFAVVWPLIRAIQLLPLSWNQALARGLGRVVFAYPPNARLILANLKVAFPDWDSEKARSVGVRSLQNFAGSLFEFLWGLKRADRVAQHVAFSEEDRRMLEKLKGSGGLIALSPHIGNWELGNFAINEQGFLTRAVARVQPNPMIQAFIQKGRTASGGRVIHEKGAAREILKALRAGDTIIMLVDQNTKPHVGGIFVDFFGLPVSMSRAPASFAKRTGAGIAQIVCLRQPDGGYRVFVRALPQDLIKDATEEEICREINRLSEELIAEYPDQYLWLYERFRYIPKTHRNEQERFPFYAKIYDRKKTASVK